MKLIMKILPACDAKTAVMLTHQTGNVEQLFPALSPPPDPELEPARKPSDIKRRARYFRRNARGQLLLHS
jgi:hypothetical protein